MVRTDDRPVRTMRTLIQGARSENSRMVAAAIGGHLSRLTHDPRTSTGLDGASDRVRDASLDLLRALHCGRDIHSARMVALQSVDGLEAVLAAPAASKGNAIERSSHRADLRRAVRRRLSDMIPGWRS